MSRVIVNNALTPLEIQKKKTTKQQKTLEMLSYNSSVSTFCLCISHGLSDLRTAVLHLIIKN